MKRNILIYLSLIFTFAATSAAPITRSKAAAGANAFVYGEPAMKSAPIIASGASDNVIEPYYIFNIGENEGFVIMSGDDAACPVLGYSCSGHIDVANMPANMKAWLDGYAADLKKLQQKNLPSRRGISEAPGWKPVKPLLTCHWDQKYPYNKQCPRYNRETSPRPTGCVATAMAQVMYYYRWPEDKTPAIREYTFEDMKILGGDGSHKTLPELQPTIFNWQLMADTYGVNSSTDSEDEVAKLMRYVGQSVQMMYGVNASGAFSEIIPSAMIDYFGYDKTARIIYRDRYKSQAEWNAVIYNEIKEGRPVLYSGATSDESGHQFVCDGYDNNDFFHINWGWGGISDGYFKLHILDPFEQGTGGAGTGMSFSQLQSAVIGVRPVAFNESLAVNDVEAFTGSEQEVQIALNNKRDDYISLQFDMLLPDGVTIAADSEGSANVSFVQSRSKEYNHEVSVSMLSRGCYRFVVYSPTNSCIAGNEGVLISAILKFAPDMSPGHFKGSLKNVVICSKNLEEINLPDSEYLFSVIEKKYQPGDVNRDDKIDGADIKALSDYVLGLSLETFDTSLADIDADGTVSVADVMLVMDMVRKMNNENRHIIQTTANCSDNVSLRNTYAGIGMSLKNTTVYKAMQFDLYLPQGVSVTGETLSDIRLAGFTIRKSLQPDGSMRYLIYAHDSRNFQLNDGSIVQFATDRPAAEAGARNIVMVTSCLEKMSLEDASYTVPSGIDDAETYRNTTILYTPGGIKAGMSGTIRHKGIYIEKGKKVIAR